MSYLPIITVAAADSRLKKEDGVDFICTGKHDERVINEAILAAAQEDKFVYLLNGNYCIDAFYDFGDGGPMAAIRVPALHKEIAIIGQSFCFEKHHHGVQFYVSKEALDSMEKGEYSVIRTQWADHGLYSGALLKMENISLALDHNQKAVRGIDLRRCDRLEMKNIRVNACGGRGDEGIDDYLGVPPVAAEGCIGITMTDGSNNFIVRYDNVVAIGCYEGIQVGGEHVIMTNCAAALCCYGYTFGNYEYHYGFNHPITMINCCDERNVNLPLFNRCGDEDWDGKRLIGGQEVTMISFNIERTAEHTPGHQLGDVMREVYPGSFCGRIEYSLQPDWHHTNETSVKLFEDGCGGGFRVLNMTHKPVCTSSERRGYYPALGEQIFDTDLNRMLICTDADTGKWVDFCGTEVE